MLAFMCCMVLQARVAYGAQDAMDSASVLFGPSSSVTFVEDEEYKTAEAAIGDFEGWHIAFYMANFSSVYDRVCDAGINLLDHKYNDKAPTLEDALKWSQFRMVDILAVDDSPEGCPTSTSQAMYFIALGMRPAACTTLDICGACTTREPMCMMTMVQT
jgi:hypothetical protein